MNVKRSALPPFASPIAPAQALTLLGGISPAQFMQEYWQKKPLLIRQAIPALQPLFTPQELAALAADSQPDRCP